MTPPGVFVTGTDTGAGKTLVAAICVRAWRAAYWKPIQTGLETGPGDSKIVAQLAGAGAGEIIAPAYSFAAPRSPYHAALRADASIDFERLQLPTHAGRIVVEGAGGVLVPIDAKRHMIDLMARLALPVVVVARSRLGTINHTLLTVEALRARGCAIAGIVLDGPADPENRRAIESFGQVRVIAEVPPLAHVTQATIAQLAATWPDFASVVG